MKAQVRGTVVRRHFSAAACLLLVLIFPARLVTACSWDYPLWMIHSRDADPLYRFVQKGRAGYIDRSGKVVIKPTLEVYGNYGSAFQNGLLHLGVSDASYLDTTGKVVIKKNYSSAWDFSDGLAAAMPEGTNKWGYIDRTGEFVISPRFDTYPKGYVFSFSEGMAMINVGRKYGYIDRTGEFVIRPTLLHGAAFRDGMARVVVEGPCVVYFPGPCASPELVGEETKEPSPMCKFTFIDKTGSLLSDQRFDSAKDFSEGLAPVMLGEKWGYIDKKGHVMIEPKFDEAEPFSDGLAKIKEGDLYGYIDHTGAIVIPPRFKYAEDFNEGLAVVGHWNDEGAEDTEYYYINKRGKQAIQEKFRLASHFFKGVAHVKLKSNKRNDDEDDGDSDERGTFAYINSSGRKIFTYKREAED